MRPILMCIIRLCTHRAVLLSEETFRIVVCTKKELNRNRISTKSRETFHYALQDSRSLCQDVGDGQFVLRVRFLNVPYPIGGH